MNCVVTYKTHAESDCVRADVTARLMHPNWIEVVKGSARREAEAEAIADAITNALSKSSVKNKLNN